MLLRNFGYEREATSSPKVKVVHTFSCGCHVYFDIKTLQIEQDSQKDHQLKRPEKVSFKTVVVFGNLRILLKKEDQNG